MVVAVEASNFLADIHVIQALQVLLFMLTTCASSGSHRRLLWLPHDEASNFLADIRVIQAL